MAAMQLNSQNPTRVILAIAAKDITDGIRNKNTLTVIVLALFMALVYHFMPGMSYDADRPNLFVYDAGGSALVSGWKTNPLFQVYPHTSQEALLSRAAGGEYPELSLSIPAGFVDAIEQGSPVTIHGYVMHWIDQEDIDNLTTRFERLLSETTGKNPDIQIDIERIYPQIDSRGISVRVGWGVIFVQLIIGIALIPHLMFEEKQFRTMDALLVSPANPLQIVLAKGLAGLFYGLVAGAIAVLINWKFLPQLWIAGLVIILGSLLVTAIGLIIGTIFENRQQYILWGWVLAMVLFVPLIAGLESELFPAIVTRIAQAFPSWSLFSLLNLAFTDQAPLGIILSNTGLLALYIAILVAFEAWLLRRSDR